MWNYILYLLLLLCCGTDAKSSTVGKHFVFGILNLNAEMFHNDDNIVSVDVTNASPRDATIHLNVSFVTFINALTVFNNQTYDTIRTGQSKTYNITNKIQKDGTFKEARGIEITADNDICVTVTNTYDSSNTIDVYNVFPTTSLGKRYTISSYKGAEYSMYGSEFMVTGIYDNTTVTYAGNHSRSSVILNSREVYQVFCNSSCDMNGYRVISDKDIYVISGSSSSQIPFGSGHDDYIASEIIPESNWTMSYIVPPVIPQPSFVLKIVSRYDSHVNVSNTTQSYTVLSNLSNHEDQYFEDFPVVLKSDKPIGVTQYGLNIGGNGDPFMTVVPGVHQYINDHYFSVPHAYYGNVKHYVAIIVPKTVKDELMLDNQTVQSHNQSTGSINMLDVPEPFDNFTVLQYEVTEGVHHFWHPDVNVTFGVFVYGLGEGLAYGFYAGYDIEGKEAGGAEFETTNETSSTSIDTTTDSIIIEGLGCYRCNNLTSLDQCATVSNCSRNEVCFVEMYTESGEQKYRSGCLQSEICQANKDKALHLDDQCVDCCRENYCNNKGCGQAGIPDRKSRGPICFDCQNVPKPDACHTVIQCTQHQQCRIDEVHNHFKMGCGHSVCSPATRTLFGSHVLKRAATPTCSFCCNDDFCNKQCTNNNQGPNLIG